MKKNLNKAAGLLSIIVGGLGFFNAIISWINNGGNGSQWFFETRAGLNYLFGSFFAPIACIALIVFGALMLVGIVKGRAFNFAVNIIMIVAAALSSVWFSNTVQAFLTAALIVFFVIGLYNPAEQGAEETEEQDNGEVKEEPAAEKKKQKKEPKADAEQTEQ